MVQAPRVLRSFDLVGGKRLWGWVSDDAFCVHGASGLGSEGPEG